MTGRRSLAVGLLALLTAISTVATLAACTSGTTANCSGDAASACDPYEAGPAPTDGGADSHGG